MKMYLVLCKDPRPCFGWFAYSAAVPSFEDTKAILERADRYDLKGREIQYKVIDFWLDDKYNPGI